MDAVPRHQCLIYDGPPSAQLTGLAAVTIAKLEAGCRCLFLNSPTMVAGFRSYLAAAGLDVAREVEKGSLVLSSDQHLTDGLFDVQRMLGMLSDAVDQALKDGYATLWASGDMMWELGSHKNLERLLEYECGLEALLRQTPALSGICQYHRETLPASAIHVALLTHQAVYVNETLSRMNPFCTTPDALGHEQPGVSGDAVDEMLHRLHLP